MGADELRGVVSNPDPGNDRFTLNGNVTVNYAGATLIPAGTIFSAVTVELENLSNPDMIGREGEQHEIEAKGTIVSGVLVASEIEFEGSRVVLRGKASAVNASARTLTVLGQTVVATDLTQIETRDSGGEGSQSLGALVANVECVELRATAAGSQLVADEIKELGQCARDVVQARVTAKNELGFTLRFFDNLNAALGGTGVVFRDDDERPISREAFFASVTPAGANHPGTLVEVKGTMVSGTLVAEEVELED